MSAIWGAIDFNGNSIEQSIKDVFFDIYSKCKIDRVETYDAEGAYIVSGIQYVTETAHLEKGPVEDDGIVFASDTIVDNCTELLEQLGRRDNLIPDGEILRLYHLKYGVQGLNTPRGAYTYLSYDKVSNTVELVADAQGVRYVYYYMEEGRLFFSSLLEPLRRLKKNAKVNERWIADYLKQDNLGIFIEGEDTSVDGILRVGPAGYLKIAYKDNEFIVEKDRYWDPVIIKSKIRYKNNDEYRKHFRELYEDCVRCMLRSSGETAVLLSGGFDSTSVAVLAGPMLAERGKKLYSYTSVPMKGYENDCESSYFPDETDAVRKTVEQYPMIEPTFMDLPQMDPWRDRKWYSDIAELPYKSAENMLWIYKGFEMAGQANCKIILTGSFGNGTVSYSNLMVYMTTLVRHLRWIQLLKEAKGFQVTRGISRKRMLKDCFKLAYSKVNEDELRAVRPDAIYRRDTVEELCSKEWFEEDIRLKMKFEKDVRLHQLAFFPIGTIRQYSEYAQKHSLYSGVINRDPTRDKRLMEFVLGLPQNQFTHNGMIRALVTDYMSDVMPRYILEMHKQGAQSADMRQRLKKDWDNITAEWLQIFETHRDNKWIDCEKAIEQIRTHKYEEYGNFDLLRLMYSAMLLEYLDGFNMER